jgi:CubicO group peptidase (beta-lactamase class C family)
MAEQLTGKPWEELIQSRLFQPLKMTSVGFGFPGTKDQVDQPWGHGLLFGSGFDFGYPLFLVEFSRIHSADNRGSQVKWDLLHLRDFAFRQVSSL